jgi:hypothetical protein
MKFHKAIEELKKEAKGECFFISHHYHHSPDGSSFSSVRFSIGDKENSFGSGTNFESALEDYKNRVTGGQGFIESAPEI